METTDERQKTKRRHPLHHMRDWRLARGMRQQDLAQACGTVKSLISRYETGAIGMSMVMQLRVMFALNIGPDEFFLHPSKAKKTPARLREIQRFFRAKREEIGESLWRASGQGGRVVVDADAIAARP